MNNMKNMIVLKNLPSNIVEEAIVILKANKKIKQNKFAVNKESLNNKEKESEDYIIKEAEMIIADYVLSLEKDPENEELKLLKNYKRIKYVLLAVSIVCWVQFVMILA